MPLVSFFELCGPNFLIINLDKLTFESTVAQIISEQSIKRGDVSRQINNQARWVVDQEVYWVRHPLSMELYSDNLMLIDGSESNYGHVMQ